jgi:hypothetical protein
MDNKIMPVSVSWDNESRTVLCFRISGYWTWQEFNWAWLESMAMMRSVPHTVNTIVDLSQVSNFPLDLLTRSVQYVRSQPRNWGISIFSTTNSFLTLMFSTFRSMAPRESTRLQFAPSMEVARQTLAALPH